MNLNPLKWLAKKYLEELIQKEIKSIFETTKNLEKENIGLTHKIIDHKERISKLEDRLRESEIKLTSFSTAFDVIKSLNQSNN